MPWRHCGTEIRDDEEKCPACGAPKARWTMRIDKTRKFVIGYPSITIALVDDAGAPVADEPYLITMRSGAVAEGKLGPNGQAKVKLSVNKTEWVQVGFPGRLATGVGPMAPRKGAPATSLAKGEDPSRFECAADGSYVFELIVVSCAVTSSWEPESLVATTSAAWEPESLDANTSAAWEPESLAPEVEPAPFEGESLEPGVEPAPFEGESLAPEVEPAPFEGESLEPEVGAAWTPDRLSA